MLCGWVSSLTLYLLSGKNEIVGVSAGFVTAPHLTEHITVEGSENPPIDQFCAPIYGFDGIKYAKRFVGYLRIFIVIRKKETRTLRQFLDLFLLDRSVQRSTWNRDMMIVFLLPVSQGNNKSNPDAMELRKKGEQKLFCTSQIRGEINIQSASSK